MSEPTVVKTDDLLSTVSGTFYRAVDPGHEADVLRGSRIPGRYSPTDAPTLYVSSSRVGVSMAMRAHSSQRAVDLNVVTLIVEAQGVFDLRDPDALASAGIDLADAAALHGRTSSLPAAHHLRGASADAWSRWARAG